MKKIKKNIDIYIHMCITESLYCIPETKNIANQLCFNKKTKKSSHCLIKISLLGSKES